VKYLKKNRYKKINRAYKHKTYPNLYDLKSHKINTEFKNLRIILDTIKKLGHASTTQIWHYLDLQTQESNDKVKEHAQGKYESGGFSSNHKRDEYIRKNIKRTITPRTIQSAVRRLWKEYGLIEKEGKQYSLAPKALYDIRYFPDDFAMPAVHSLIPFSVKNVEQSLEEFIVRFGAYIVFTFIEAMRPIKDNDVNLLNNERLLNLWFQDAIPIKELFDLFSSLYHKKDDEMKDTTIRKLTQVFEKRYPEIYRELSSKKLATIQVTRPISTDTSKPMSSLDLGEALKKRKRGEQLQIPAGAFGWNRALAWLPPRDWYSQLGS
jgi:hypothetical protein